jgi:signal recognition particle receptor subunit beta
MLDDGKGPRPIKPPYFSAGELIRIVAKIYASLNPILKTIFIDDFDVVDDPGQEKILKELLEAGFQIITMEVRKTQDRENVITLKECAIDTGEEKKPDLI